MGVAHSLLAECDCSCRGHLGKAWVVRKPRFSLASACQEKVRELVDTYLDSDLSVECMAAEVGISPFHFSRLFRVSFGMPPYHYVLQMRIARAAYLLRSERQRTDADIALEVGFASQAHLTHAFKQHLGETPARWREA